jgi:hypothetical protein
MVTDHYLEYVHIYPLPPSFALNADYTIADDRHPCSWWFVLQVQRLAYVPIMPIPLNGLNVSDKPSLQMFAIITTANIPTIRPLFSHVFGIQSAAPNSYPLQPSSKRKSLTGNKDRYITIGDIGHSESTVTAEPTHTASRSVDRGFPLPRSNTLPHEAEGRSSEQGIMKNTAFEITYERAR